MTNKLKISYANIREKFDVAQDRIGIIYDAAYIPHVMALVARAENKHFGQMHVTLEIPTKKMSTGFRSQNSRIHGHCEDIAAQLVDATGEPEYSQEQIKAAMKRMAVAAGYPTVMNLDGVEEPMSLSLATMDQAKLVIDVIQHYADMNGLYLTEYDETGERYLSLGGRSREEMEQ